MTADPMTLAVGALASVAVLGVKSLVDSRRRKRTEGHHVARDTAGDKPVEFWQAEQRKGLTEVLVATTLPILAQQTTILAELKGEQTESRIQMMRLITLIEERLRT